MSDSSIFVASGSLNGLDPTVSKNNNPTYEILNADGTPRRGSTEWPLLVKAQPYYMYPFLHLLNDGTLFSFASKSSEALDIASGRSRKTFPDLPGTYRTYPNTGGSVLLPLSSANNWEPEILICGGGAYQDINPPSDPSCGPSTTTLPPPNGKWTPCPKPASWSKASSSQTTQSFGSTAPTAAPRASTSPTTVLSTS